MVRHTLPAIASLLVSHCTAQGLDAAQPMGGLTAIQLLIEQELRYPVAALEAGIKGEVTVVVGVSADGTVQGMRVWRELCPECDAEALRILRMVRFVPSTATENRGSADHYLVVPFDPAKYKRWVKARPKRESPVFELPASDSLAVFQPKQLDTQVVPLVPKGNAGLGQYLADNMRYPEEAHRRSIEGNVVVRFTVEPTGSVSNIHALEELGGGCTAEAIRLIAHTPWAPGVRGGRRVRSTLDISIRFKLPQQDR